MNAAAILSLCAAALQLGMGLLLVGLARAPGWRAARTFALIALTAAVYSAADVFFALPAASDSAVMWASRANYCMGSFHAAAWLLYTFGGPSATPRNMPRAAQILAVALTSIGLFILLTGAEAVPGEFTNVKVPWAGVQYHTVKVRPWAEWYALLILATFLVPFVAYMQRAWRQQPGAGTHLAGFTVFFACMSVEVLVTNGVLSTLFLGDVGFLAVVIPVAVATVRRVVSDAQQLNSLSLRLASEVESRTEALDRARSALLQSERHAALGRLAAGVGHEINNPLTYLTLSLEGVETWANGATLPADVREALANARDGTERIRLVVDGLRSYMRTTAGEYQAISPASIVRNALRVAAHQVQHVAQVHVDRQPTAAVLGDEPRLVQVLVNLITNAAQAAVEANLTRVVEITVRAYSLPDGHVVMEVCDTGPGISPNDLRRLAEPYFTTRANAGGTGLGLFLSRAIVEQHNGRLEIESTLGSGTVARVVLPPASADIILPVDTGAPTPPGRATNVAPVNVVADAPDAPIFTALTTPPREIARIHDGAARRRVLLVDDEPLVARVMARTLAPYCDVCVAESGIGAIAALDARLPDGEAFDVVLCDLMMPGMNGIEFAEVLRKRDPSLRRRTLFLTGGAVTEAAVSFLEREDVRYLTKPVGTAELVRMIEQTAAKVVG